MPNLAEDQVKKVTIYIYEKDWGTLRTVYGDWGWGRQVREILHTWIKEHINERDRRFQYDSGRFDDSPESA